METAIHTAAQPPDVIALALWRMAKGKENDVIPVAYAEVSELTAAAEQLVILSDKLGHK